MTYTFKKGVFFARMKGGAVVKHHGDSFFDVETYVTPEDVKKLIDDLRDIKREFPEVEAFIIRLEM